MHVPTWLDTLQLWHKPLLEDEQPVSQHTPSMQLPLTHWFAAEHDAPLPFLPHELFTQVFGLTHWLSAVQLVRQRPVVESHVKAPHCTVDCDGHASPRPSQNDAASDDDEVEQDGPLHWLFVWYTSHAPLRHVPFVPQVLTSFVAHLLSPVPLATAEHVPAEPLRLHARQAPEQSELQQTPWAQ